MGTAASPLLNPTTNSPNGVGRKPTAEVRLRRTQQRRQTQDLIPLIDLDWFKRINNTYGHPTGDRFGRYGDEDFLLVLPDTSNETAARTLDRLRTIASLVPEFDHSSPRTKTLPRVQPTTVTPGQSS